MMWALALVCGFYIGASFVISTLTPFIMPAKLAQATAAVAAYVPSLPLVIMAFLAACALLALLVYLPYILEHHPSDKTDK